MRGLSDMSTLAHYMGIQEESQEILDVDEEFTNGALHPLVPSAAVTYYYNNDPETKAHVHYETGM
jgi:hypothetical protein